MDPTRSTHKHQNWVMPLTESLCLLWTLPSQHQDWAMPLTASPCLYGPYQVNTQHQDRNMPLTASPCLLWILLRTAHNTKTVQHTTRQDPATSPATMDCATTPLNVEELTVCWYKVSRGACTEQVGIVLHWARNR